MLSLIDANSDVILEMFTLYLVRFWQLNITYVAVDVSVIKICIWHCSGYYTSNCFTWLHAQWTRLLLSIIYCSKRNRFFFRVA